MSKGGRPSRMKTDKRRDRVKSIIARGITSPTRIAKMVDCSRQTVYNDQEAIKREIEEKTHVEAGEFLVDMLLNYEEVQKELWRTIQDCEDQNNSGGKVGALRTLTSLQKEKINQLQKLGVLEKQPEEIKMSNSLDYDTIRKRVKELKDGEE